MNNPSLILAGVASLGLGFIIGIIGNLIFFSKKKKKVQDPSKDENLSSKEITRIGEDSSGKPKNLEDSESSNNNKD